MRPVGSTAAGLERGASVDVCVCVCGNKQHALEETHKWFNNLKIGDGQRSGNSFIR